MARTHVTLSGDRKLLRQLTKMAAEVPVICSEALHDWGDAVKDAAQDRVPYDTGRLHDAIENRVDDGRLVAEVGVWESDAYYAEFVENGTSRQTAQPFLNPAFEDNRDPRPHVRKAVDKRWPS